MEGPRVFLFLVLLFLFFASPNTRPPSLAQQLELEHVVAEERYAVGLLNGSSHGDFDPSADRWINITGFRRNDGYSWELLPYVRSKAREQRQRIFYAFPAALESLKTTKLEAIGNSSRSDTEDLPSSVETTDDGDQVYQNITGFIRGKWVRWEPVVGHQRPTLNLTTLAPSTFYARENFLHNVTGQEGDLRFKLDEKLTEYFLSSDGYAREIEAEMTLKDEGSSGDGWSINLYGLHYPHHGTVVLTSTSPK